MASILVSSLRSAAVVTSLAAWSAGCGGPAASPRMTADASSDPCYVAADGAPPRDTVVVALPEPEAERFVAAHLADHPDAPDCTGAARPAALPLFRIASERPLVLVPVDSERPARVIVIRPADPRADPRDLIDRGAEVVITADAPALEYARQRGGLRLVPLTWAVTYILVVPPDAPLPVTPTPELRAELARDAVRAEARPAEPSGSDSEPRCRPRPPAAGRLEELAVPEGDRTARALAERLVALAGSGTSGSKRVVEYAPAAFDSLLAAGRAAAYVVALPAFAARPGCEASPPLPEGSTVVPLIQTRATAVLRPGVPPFLMQGDGSIRFVPPGIQ